MLLPIAVLAAAAVVFFVKDGWLLSFTFFVSWCSNDFMCISDLTWSITALLQKLGIEIAVGHRTLSDKKCYVSVTHVSKEDILS